jgi:uncharacterized protein (TIGR03083 family)
MSREVPIQTLPLFPVLDEALLTLLRGLSPEAWQTQTIAKRWTVKDVAAHLLDGNLRGLSVSRDGYTGDKAEGINSYGDLVAFVNTQNLRWTDAAKRMSPGVLIDLLERTGIQYTEHLQSLDPFAPAVFSVAWTGHATSPNWFHIAREYTEKFLHQQQIRDALGIPGIMTRELFHPFIDTLMQALPHTFHETDAPAQTTVTIVVSTDIGGQWSVVKTNAGWDLQTGYPVTYDARVTIDPDTAWKLFSKSLSVTDIINHVTIAGDSRLGMQALRMVAVMA